MRNLNPHANDFRLSAEPTQQNEPNGTRKGQTLN
jgi:hypothetical protein